MTKPLQFLTGQQNWPGECWEWKEENHQLCKDLKTTYTTSKNVWITKNCIKNLEILNASNNNLFNILPLGVWSKNWTGALISFLSNVLCTFTAALKPPKANEKALANVRQEFMIQKMQSIACTNSEETGSNS